MYKNCNNIIADPKRIHFDKNLNRKYNSLINSLESSSKPFNKLNNKI
jgi:hypothetical protein